MKPKDAAKALAARLQDQGLNRQEALRVAGRRIARQECPEASLTLSERLQAIVQHAKR